jgi:hypothetical protein
MTMSSVGIILHTTPSKLLLQCRYHMSGGVSLDIDCGTSGERGDCHHALYQTKYSQAYQTHALPEDIFV